MTKDALKTVLVEDDYNLVIASENPTHSEKVEVSYLVNNGVKLGYFELIIDDIPYFMLLDTTDLLMDTIKVQNDVVEGIIDIIIKKVTPIQTGKVEVTNILF